MARHRFEFIAGSLALCFVDTFGDRGGAGLERLDDPRSLIEWLDAAGLLTEQAGQATQGELGQARALREAIHRCGIRAMKGEAPQRADLTAINAAALQPPLRPQWQEGRIVQTADAPLEAAFSVIAADALGLFASQLAGSIRRCPGCAMMFVDTSRPGRRRWCSSVRGCGNRAKVNRLRARRAGQGTKGK